MRGYFACTLTVAPGLHNVNYPSVESTIMPKMTRQTPAMKRVVREIQRWLAKHEYQCAFRFKLHRCGLYDQYNRLIAISRTGVVVVAGGGCYIERWTEYRTGELRRFLNGAKRIQEQDTKAKLGSKV